MFINEWQLPRLGNETFRCPGDKTLVIYGLIWFEFGREQHSWCLCVRGGTKHKRLIVHTLRHTRHQLHLIQDPVETAGVGNLQKLLVYL